MKDLLIDELLYDKIASFQNRSPVRKVLFAASQGQKVTKTFDPSISNLTLKNKKIIGTVHIRHDIIWREGLITLKNRNFAETIIVALKGQKLGILIDEPILGKAIIKTARTKDGNIEIRVKCSHKPFADLWSMANA